jgi:hypothetical protein
MSISYLSNLIQNNLGCWHYEYDIKKVQVSASDTHPQYCVIADCKRCNQPVNHVIQRPRESDSRSVAAAAWLVSNNFDFVTGKPLNES